MKKIVKYTLSLIIIFSLSSGCDDGFDELNVHPTAPSNVNPEYIFNHAIITTSHPTSIFIFELAIVQQIITPNGSSLAGANFNVDNRNRPGLWISNYRNVLKSTTEVLDRTRDDENLSNLHNMARIWRAYSGMILTDTFGDVPFSEAGVGFIDRLSLPSYDTQQSIYREILSELEQAAAALDASKAPVRNEVFYNGDVEKWKRFAYSLMLRAAMRHSKVDQALAQEYVSKAIAGGLMQSNADNAKITHSNLYTNPTGVWLNGTEANNYYLAAPFVNYLKDNDDPRLASIAVRYMGATSGAQQLPAAANRDPSVQLGMPMGHDNNSIPPVVQNLGLASFYEFSQLDRTRMGKLDAPAYLVTYAQTQLLLAEAVVRNWAQGDVGELYSNAIRAHMNQLADYGPNTAIDPAAIETFVQANPLNTANALEEINTEYWVSSFLNGPEAFANFRRSGYPALAPNPYPGKEISGDFIRRLTYPDDEASVNSGNRNAAIQRQGPDNLETRVWWDVQ
ncbi:SusD/RagB family nutrient-binding outer membrane lipoprotein [soil metagenome]